MAKTTKPTPAAKKAIDQTIKNAEKAGLKAEATVITMYNVPADDQVATKDAIAEKFRKGQLSNGVDYEFQLPDGRNHWGTIQIRTPKNGPATIDFTCKR